MRNKDRYERAFGSVLLVYEREGGRGGGGVEEVLDREDLDHGHGIWPSDLFHYWLLPAYAIISYIYIYLIWILPSTRVQYIPPILHSFVRCFLLLYSSRCPYAMHV